MMDWTCDEDDRANSSEKFLSLVKAVSRLIIDDARMLLLGRAESTARLIVAQLAHVHKLAPQEDSNE